MTSTEDSVPFTITINLWKCISCNLYNFIDNNTCSACFNQIIKTKNLQIISIEKVLTLTKKYGYILLNNNESIAKRMRMCFHLKQLNTISAIKELNKGFTHCNSALLKHEIAYVLGQMRNRYSIPLLNIVLQDCNQQCIVRHEAAEALSAIGDLTKESLKILTKFACNESENESIRETCKLALKSDEFYKAMKTNANRMESNEIFCQQLSKYNSVDPAPPFMPNKYSIQQLRTIFLDLQSSELGLEMKLKLNSKKYSLFDRYRAMFSLRDLASNSDECVDILCGGFVDNCSLFKHEIAFVLGQIMNRSALIALLKVLKNEKEIPMVRHEAAEAIGNIVNEEDKEILEYIQHFTENKIQHFTENKIQHFSMGVVPKMVSQSCEVAIDMFHFWHHNDK